MRSPVDNRGGFRVGRDIVWLFLVMGSVLLVLTCISGCGESPKIKVGVGETVITPPVGTPMAGYRRTDVSKGVHDDLHARSLVIEGEDGTGMVLMTLSIINLDYSYMDRIRGDINGQTGIPKENILISCTHTHSGPSIEGASEEYRELLIRNSVASAVKAWNSRVPGRIGTGSTICLELGRNDRRMEYGGLHPDPEVGIVKVENAKGRLLGVAFNYGCHPSTLDLYNLEFTEDWPYYAIRGIKESLGESVWAAYFQSAQGDVKVGYTAELSAVGAAIPIRTFWYAEIKGNDMRWAVLEALYDIPTSGNPVLKTAGDFFDFPQRDSYHITAKEAEQRYDAAKARLAEMEKKADAIGKRVLDRYRVYVFLNELTADCARWVENNPDPEPVSVQLQAFRIGDAVFVTFPCEVFSEIGLKVKQQSPFEKTFVIGLASGHRDYMPTAEEYLEGGYAAVKTRWSPKCEQVLIDSSLELIGRIKD